MKTKTASDYVNTFEIQVISGLHAGARYRISKARFSLGGGDDADMRLLDELFESANVEFEQTESGSLAIHTDGDYDLVSAHGRSLGRGSVWNPGQLLKVAEVWFALAPEGAALQEVCEWAASGEEFDSDGSDHSDSAAGFGDVEPEFEQAPAFDTQSLLRRRAAAGFVGGVCVMLVIGLGFAWMPSEANTDAAVTANQPQYRQNLAKSGPAQVPTMDPARDQQVREILAGMLADAGFKDEVAVRVGLGEISVSATLAEDRVTDFERVLAQTETSFGAHYKIGAAVEPIAVAPDFRIREVVLGKDGWIVTDAGKRVIVGGEIGGYRLVSIDAGKVVLAGARRIEIQI